MSATTWLYGPNAYLVEELRSLVPDTTAEDAPSEERARRVRDLVLTLARDLAGREARTEEIRALLRGEALPEDLLRSYMGERLAFLDRVMYARPA